MAQPLSQAILDGHLKDFLAKRQPPKTFCPSEVARALTAQELQSLGFAEWRSAMPAIRELAWEMRERGELEVTQKGVALGVDVGVEDVVGPIRIRRVE
ncbi:hypothetical protein LTR08_002771 [Meristemomyces frigidus]|nr:hypothetical protein LTR08_002771 [Meristemomyces frigidus]